MNVSAGHPPTTATLGHLHQDCDTMIIQVSESEYQLLVAAAVELSKPFPRFHIEEVSCILAFAVHFSK